MKNYDYVIMKVVICMQYHLVYVNSVKLYHIVCAGTRFGCQHYQISVCIKWRGGIHAYYNKVENSCSILHKPRVALVPNHYDQLMGTLTIFFPPKLQDKIWNRESLGWLPIPHDSCHVTSDISNFGGIKRGSTKWCSLSILS